MSSHREAPEISKDPVADSTDFYAFVSPDAPNTVTLISNYIPLEAPDGGPNFYEFGDDVLYEIHIDNNGNGDAEITYQFRFTTIVRNPEIFLYNTGQITSLDSQAWNRPQVYSVTRIKDGNITVLGTGLASPPCNIGPRSTPGYAALAQAAVHTLGNGIKVFAGQRREGFFVDLGSIFDLGGLRPLNADHLIPLPKALGVDSTVAVNVHSIAIQVPITDLTRDGSMPSGVTAPTAAIGAWCTAKRQKTHVRRDDQMPGQDVGPWTQVSRLGNPLVNEVIIPMGKKDAWNAASPENDAQFLSYVLHPSLASLLNVLYPNAFPHLAAYAANGSKSRADLAAILMTGIPYGVLKDGQGKPLPLQTFTGQRPADMLRLNLAVPPATNPNSLGVVGGDLAGFPNGRRVFDDTVNIELKAVAGATLPLVDPSFMPDAAVALVDEGVTPNMSRYLSPVAFPYLGLPLDGYDTPAS
jgi:hypothetical protein